MLTPQQKHERGQAVVLMVFAIIGLLGFAGVALDGGNIYTEQRRAQSAADNAVIAAAYVGMHAGVSSITATTAMASEAYTSAVRNGFNNDHANNWVTFNTPPKSGTYSGTLGYIEVIITEVVPTVLAHLVYQGPWQVTVRAIARSHPYKDPAPPYEGKAVMSTASGPNACGAFTFNGSGDLNVVGASIFTNSSCGPGSNQSNAAGVANGNSDIIITGGSFGAAGGIYDPHSNITATGGTSENAAPVENPTDMPVPTSTECGPNRTYSYSSNSTTLQPGTYPNGIQVGSPQSAVMMGGIYCLGAGTAGDAAFDIAGDISTDANGNGVQDSGEGVLIYLKQSDNPLVDVTAQASLILWAMDSGTWSGLLIYAPSTVCGDVEINGGGDLALVGTIYTPCADVSVNGNSGTFSLYSQIIGKTVDIGGTGSVSIIYDPSILYSYPVPPSSLIVQ